MRGHQSLVRNAGSYFFQPITQVSFHNRINLQPGSMIAMINSESHVPVRITLQQKARMCTPEILFKSTDLYFSILRMIVFMLVDERILEQQKPVELERRIILRI